MEKVTLAMCQYSEYDDINYLSNDYGWIESRAERLEEEEKEALFELVQSLHTTDLIQLKNPLFIKKVFQNCFDKKYIEKLRVEKRKTIVRIIFLAAVFREIILKSETVEDTWVDRASFLERYPFLSQQEGTNVELTWLKRYERALRYIAEVLPSDNNKTMMMAVAAQLQGSSVFTEYITGGANRPETQRRVDIFQALVKYTPRKRAPRVSMKKEAATVLPEVPKRKRGRPRKDSTVEGSVSTTTTSMWRDSEQTNSDDDDVPSCGGESDMAETMETDLDFQSFIRDSLGDETFRTTLSSESIIEDLQLLDFDEEEFIDVDALQAF